ncbi:hypothetical protein V6N11_076092 [Hibiscus sabdariffa]|uniref:Uncharacterized protein n=1 Tax=Hibiscus sabdariffa TaxID=183260 RepID=A0ABR2Q5U1_9ROSI
MFVDGDGTVPTESARFPFCKGGNKQSSRFKADATVAIRRQIEGKQHVELNAISGRVVREFPEKLFFKEEDLISFSVLGRASLVIRASSSLPASGSSLASPTSTSIPSTWNLVSVPYMGQGRIGQDKARLKA